MKAAFPILIFLIFLSIFAMFFSGGSFGEGIVYSDSLRLGSNDGGGWYDVGGRHICYANFTLVAGVENGHVTHDPSDYGAPMWVNGSGVIQNKYKLYDTPYGEAGHTDAWFSFFVGSQLGFLTVLGIIMTVAAVAGLRVLGSGVSDTSVKSIVLCGVMFGLFMLCSSLCYSFIVAIPYVGAVFYFVLTAVYTFDVVGSAV